MTTLKSTGLALLYLATFVCALASCSEESEEGATQPAISVDVPSNGSDTPAAGDDIYVPEPCVGFAKPGDAEAAHDDECKGVKECKEMDKPESGGCYCAQCGPQGIEIKCLQVLCN